MAGQPKSVLTPTIFERLKYDLRHNWQLYLIFLPALVYYIVFHYAPMYGVQIAFRNYIPAKGIWKSEWWGLYHFERFFRSYNSRTVIFNTLRISLLSLILGFPCPILLALLVNELRFARLKKTIQMISYAPHFISTVAIAGMLTILFSVQGPVAALCSRIGNETYVNLLTKPKGFLWIYVLSGVWQGMGWGTIIYLAAITGISGELYEAAMIDGANRWQRMWNITLPGIRGTVVTLLIMNLGKVMGSNYERLDQFGNTQVKDFSYQLAIYIYDKGLASAKFSMATAVGIFQSLVGLVLVLLSDRIAKMLGEEGLL